MALTANPDLSGRGQITLFKLVREENPTKNKIPFSTEYGSARNNILSPEKYTPRQSMSEIIFEASEKLKWTACINGPAPLTNSHILLKIWMQTSLSVSYSCPNLKQVDNESEAGRANIL
jgi:hypothetical protein